MNAQPTLFDERTCTRGHLSGYYARPNGRIVCIECNRLSKQRYRDKERVRLDQIPRVVAKPPEGEGVDVDDGTRYSLADWKAKFPATWARISLASTDSEAWGSTWERDE